MSLASRAWLGALLGVPLIVGCAARHAAGDGDPFVNAVRAIRPSVVLFTMKIPANDPHRRGQLDDAYGSGVIVASGHWGSQVLTVAHVVADARNLHVRLDDRRTFGANVVATNAETDLALVATDARDLPAARLGSSRSVQLGQAVGVAGYPIPDAFGDEGLGISLSAFAGRIAGIDKDALELDLPVIPGESGGPVFDAVSGAVLGLAESRFEDEHAIGFAIPIDDARRFLHGRLRSS
ncbi:MAG: S1C family serine protease [Vulcanimicrobiaceae bacterium]